MEARQATLNFYRCNQKPWQTVEDYAEELKALWRQMRNVLKEQERGFTWLEDALGKHHELVPRYIDGLEDDEYKRKMWDWYHRSERKSGRHPRFEAAVHQAAVIQIVDMVLS